MGRRDDGEYAEFVAAYQHRLRGAAYLMLGDWHAAASAAEAALVQIYVAWPRLRKSDSAPVHAFRALTSTVIDHGRQRRSDSNSLPGSTERETLVKALGSLPDRQRACLVLRYFEDLSIADTATALRCSTKAVSSHTASGLKSLKSELDRLGYAGDIEILGEA